MRLFLLGIILIAATFTKAQEGISSLGKRQELYQDNSSAEEQKIDSMVKLLKSHQVTNIGGIPFGISHEKALKLLKNKYGEPEYIQTTTIAFNNIKYAGYDFDSVYFLFQSDGINSYFNTCIFVIKTKTRKEAIETQEILYQTLSEKYYLSKSETENGFSIYAGGISPLWDGNWHSFNFDNEFLCALHTDIIKYDESVADYTSDKYAVRLIYGPYNYIKEEF